MEENLYAPPRATVAEVSSLNEDTELRFFAVSPFKLVVMTVTTLGLYEVYWFYKQWVLIRKHSEPDILPWARALFGVFWCYSCFEYIRNEERRLNLEPALSAGPLAAGWIATNLSWRLPAPYSIIGFAAPFFLIPVQQRINRINEQVAPGHDKNGRLSA